MTLRTCLRWLGGLMAFGLFGAMPLDGLAGDWTRFRGPNGTGVSTDDVAPPVEWDDQKNLKWKLDLPGPGLSSPIVVGDRVLVTCWSGYGMTRESLGRIENLKLHLICVNRHTGKEMWSEVINSFQPEEPYRGMFAEHGYASHTPVSDGERVYAFFGKSGIVAFDLSGKRLWQKNVGTESDRRGWGTASSPILYQDLVIVPACSESQTIYAFNKLTGEEKWRQVAAGLASTWSTPILVEAEGQTDLVMSVPYELWGLNPDTGKLRWFCNSTDTDSVCSSPVVHDGVIYVVEGRNGGSLAVKGGGKGDVSKTHVVWSGRDRSRIGTPLYHDGRLYFISSKVVNCLDAKTGERIYQSRLDGGRGEARADTGGRPQRGGGGGGMGGQDYSSPVAAGGKMYYTARSGETYVVELGPTFKQLAVNRFAGDDTDFNASPAISNGDLFIRSCKALYCVSAN
jgi:outer membrane protein assembly factor BamB